MFRDRKDAGERLGQALSAYKGDGVLVLAIPRGGVEVGHYVAKYLEARFSILVARKLPLPDNPEAGFGAIAEDGSVVLVDRVAGALSAATVDKMIADQKQEIRRRITVLRAGKPLPPVTDRTVMLVDDGIAMGSTVRAAVTLCRKERAKKIIVASPVAGPSVAADLARIADHVVILEKPIFFRAVAQAYADWYDVSDEEVLDFMKRWEDSSPVLGNESRK